MAAEKRDFQISLAGWSLHRSIGEGEGKIPMLDMPKLARQEFGIGAIELVNQMLPASDAAYLDKLAKNAADNDVQILLTMVDGEGAIGHPDAGERQDAVARHQKWIDVTSYLGGHTIRMNWTGAPNDIAARPAAGQQSYGCSVFGRGCLMARRLIETGVPFIEVDYGGWDNHANIHTTLKDQKLPVIDRGISSLVSDLEDRGLLQDTAIIWMINELRSRGADPRKLSCKLAGGATIATTIARRTADGASQPCAVARGSPIRAPVSAPRCV